MVQNALDPRDHVVARRLASEQEVEKLANTLHSQLHRRQVNPPADFPARFRAALTEELRPAEIAEWTHAERGVGHLSNLKVDEEARSGYVTLQLAPREVQGGAILDLALHQAGVNPKLSGVREAVSYVSSQVWDVLVGAVRAAVAHEAIRWDKLLDSAPHHHTLQEILAEAFPGDDVTGWKAHPTHTSWWVGAKGQERHDSVHFLVTAQPEAVYNFTLAEEHGGRTATEQVPSARPIGRGAIRIPVPDVRQKTTYTCGAAALQAVAAYFGVAPQEEELVAFDMGLDPRWGSNPEQIAEAAKEYGLQVAAYQPLSDDHLRNLLDEGKPVIIMIQAWRGENSSRRNDATYLNDLRDGHWIVAIGFDDEGIFFEDPSLSAVRGYLTNEELDARWHDLGENGERFDRYGLAVWMDLDDRAPYLALARRIP